MSWDELVPENPWLVSPHAMYLALGAFITLFGLVSLIIKDRLYMSEAMVAILVGIVVGPLALRLFIPTNIFGDSAPYVTLEFTRIVVAIQAMACGVDLPSEYLQRNWRSVAMLCGPVMAIKWLVSALGIYLIAGVSFWIPEPYITIQLDALVIAACITPTDPVLANSIVKGRFAEKHVPLNVRLTLSAESGANDGLATPFLLLAIYLQRLPPGEAIGAWLWKVVLYQVIMSIAIAITLAYITRKILKKAERNEWMDKESILSFSIAFALLMMGLVSLIGSGDIIAVFVSGNVLTWDRWFNEKVSHSAFQEVIDALLNLAYFVYIGAVMPWSSFNGGGSGLAIDGEKTIELWRLVVLAVWVLLLRRLPVVMAMSPWISSLKDWREAFFAGWFGPIGAGAIFYAYVAIIYFEFPESPILPIVFFIVLASVLVHGGSVALFNLSLSRVMTYEQWEVRRRTNNLPTVIRAEDIVVLRTFDGVAATAAIAAAAAKDSASSVNIDVDVKKVEFVEQKQKLKDEFIVSGENEYGIPLEAIATGSGTEITEFMEDSGEERNQATTAVGNHSVSEYDFGIPLSEYAADENDDHYDRTELSDVNPLGVGGATVSGDHAADANQKDFEIPISKYATEEQQKRESKIIVGNSETGGIRKTPADTASLSSSTRTDKHSIGKI
ncbi:hypothetical protein HK100_006603 [Physocladia obscura]|uniref:Cation/H+ exchanger transmembrane domain-containing protein n=1 Tax=Physocladia obscura TaxID=109957 RepID=A0AAD5X7F3_9FUNG|nr:hypothetical protein HK100_006603 [Physocladia obscura]